MAGTAGFQIVGAMTSVQVIAVGRQIRQLARLKTQYGQGYWRKLKDEASVRLADGSLRRAEVHWYEAHGVGRRRIKIKRFLDAPSSRRVHRPGRS